MATQTWRDAVIDSLLKEHGYEELAQPDKEETMGRIEKRERKLLKQFFKLPGARRRVGREMAEKAAAFMGVSERDFAKGFVDGGQEERAALQAVASISDSWMEHFRERGDPPPNPGIGIDWEGFNSFFDRLVACMEKFLPLILAV